MRHNIFQSIESSISLIPQYLSIGKVISVRGLLIEALGIERTTHIGSKCKIIGRDNKSVLAEVIGFRDRSTLLLPFHQMNGIGSGSEVEVIGSDQSIYPSMKWLGRVINAFGDPIDGKGPLYKGNSGCRLHNQPPNPQLRKRVGAKMDTGLRVLNTFLNCCEGQRLGVFSGSGVGKSMMIAMLTKFASSDVKVIGLIGERGREVQEFIEDYLGPEGLAKAVVIVATSDESALMRKQAAYLTLAVAEYYRDIGLEVLCLFDSVTRFAMAQREIGLSAGEPPTSKGYTPSVFTELAQLLERAGPGVYGAGSITALFSVLVEGDDHNEPIADAVRGILDGHIVLERSIAARGIYPAIDILSSISRTMPRCNSDYETALVNKARSIIATYADMVDMIRIGAYKKGSDPKVDEAIKYNENIEKFISQRHDEKETMENSYKKLAEIIDFEYVKPNL